MKKKKYRFCILSLLLLLGAPAMVVRASEYDGDPDAALAPYFLIDGMESSTERFPLKETNVSTLSLIHI